MAFRITLAKINEAPGCSAAESPVLTAAFWVEKCVNQMIDVLELDQIVVAIPPDVLFQEVGEETVVLSIETGNYFGLNPVASRLWALFQEGRPMKEVIATVLNEFDVSEECLRADLQKFLGQLHSKGLVAIHDVNGA